MRDAREWLDHAGPYSSRVAFAAAHVVADPRGENVPGAPAIVDWNSTLGFRRELFRYGLGVAEAMDTAQRNMGLDWRAVQSSSPGARHRHDNSERGSRREREPTHRVDVGSIREVTDAYLEQVEFIENAGSQVIVMASRQARPRRPGSRRLQHGIRRGALAGAGARHSALARRGVDPQLAGYWGSRDVATATETFLDLVRAHARSIDGVRVSLLSAEHEIGLRAALPDGVRLYTGDDFNYPDLIKGDGARHSDALLGAFAAIAPAASAALAALDDGDLAGYDAEFTPTLALSRTIFEAPTFYYKTGIAFLSWLNGHQPGFTMVGGLQSARSIVHLSRVFELANEARLLRDPDLAVHRMATLLEPQGSPGEHSEHGRTERSACPGGNPAAR